jgi:DNA-binding response OmpR family regulator
MGTGNTEGIRLKVEKIMGNLFTNALKHTSPGGVIRISAHVDDDILVVSVFNSGKLIAEDRMQDVFKRYYQLADSQDSDLYGWGTGIGLYYVKRLVELHHGSVRVKNIKVVSETLEEASLRNGVEFCFALPADKSIYNKVEIADREKRVMQIPLEVTGEEGRTLEVKSEEGRVKNSLAGKASAPSKNLPRILIVDDDVDVAQYLHSIFASAYEVVNRYSAEEALADLEEVKPDLILSDVIMGQMSGFEFCKFLKSNLSFSHIPVILITAMSTMSEQIDGLQLGAVAYVTKPFDPVYLKALVKSQLHNMQMLRQRLSESTETGSLSAKVADTLSLQDQKFMDELYRWMEKRSAEQDLNVATVCHDMLISPAKFNYKIKELTGETPGIFFRKYKLNKAATWLREGKYSITEIAVLTGFSTAAHFSVAFKKQFGVSPSEYQ